MSESTKTLRDHLDQAVRVVTHLILKYDDGMIGYGDMVVEVTKALKTHGASMYDEGFRAGLTEGAPWEDSDEEEFEVRLETDDDMGDDDDYPSK